MTRPRTISRVTATLIWLVPGTAILGTSCTTEFRDSLVDAGASFVADTAADVLEALFPVGDWLSGASGETSA